MEKKKDKRSYRRGGLVFSNLEFSSRAEKRFVKNQVAFVAERIKQLRESKKLSQEKLAELAGVSLGTIRYLEQNQRAPSLPLLLKIIYALDRKANIWA